MFFFGFFLNKNEVTDPTRGVDGFIKCDLIKFVINLPRALDIWHEIKLPNCIRLTKTFKERIIK